MDKAYQWEIETQ